MSITSKYSSKPFRAAKRSIDIKFQQAEKAALKMGNTPGAKEFLKGLEDGYDKAIKGLYNNPASAEEILSKAAPAKKAAAKKSANKAAPKKTAKKSANKAATAADPDTAGLM